MRKIQNIFLRHNVKDNKKSVTFASSGGIFFASDLLQ